ncbi:MAG: F0F1 ATP synthase subunit epsilon [Azospirillum sp.]|nr:F0F1 ATP synthase subunit epsilon [Azospirillum sp.]
MRLLVTTPTTVVVDAEDVRAVRAEDESGAFGILPGHCDLLTALSVSVLFWRDRDDLEHFVAVRGGVLAVRQGRLVEIASREALASDDLGALRGRVIAAMRATAEAEAAARTQAARFQVSFLRRMHQYLEGERPQPLPFSGSIAPPAP